MLGTFVRVATLILLGRLSLGPKKKRHAIVEGRRCTARDIGLPLLMNATAADRYGLSSASARRIAGCGELDLALSPIGEEGAMALAGAMTRSSARWRDTLRHVNLSATAIGQAGAEKLLETLKDAGAKIQVLDLSGNWLGDALMHSNSLAALAEGRRANSSLRVLRVRWNGLSENSGDALAKVLRVSTRLEELDVGGNWLHTLGLQMFSPAIRGHPNLRTLRLDLNGVDTRGVLELSTAIRSNASSLAFLDLGGNDITDAGAMQLARLLENPSIALSNVMMRYNEQITDAGAQRLATAAGSSNRRNIHVELGGGSGMGRDARAQRAAVPAPMHKQNDDQRRYWRQTYPLATPSTITELVESRGSIREKPNQLMYKTAPTEIPSGHACFRPRSSSSGCPGPGARALQPHGTQFAPIGLTPTACLRSHFGKEFGVTRSSLESGNPYMAGSADNTWVEVAQVHNQSGSLRMYRATGSGLFWNCGTSLRTRNKVAAALTLTEQLSPLMSRDLTKGSPADTLAHAIASNDASACSAGDLCKAFMRSLVKDVNADGAASLAALLNRVAKGTEPPDFDGEQLSASPVFDQILWDWGKRVGYDTIQLAMQPQPTCGRWWTSELIDLRVRHHHPNDVLPFLGLKDPLAAPEEPAAACQVPTDKLSRRAFGISVYCEGTLMERSVRCFTDATRGRNARPLLRHRLRACLRVG